MQNDRAFVSVSFQLLIGELFPSDIRSLSIGLTLSASLVSNSQTYFYEQCSKKIDRFTIENLITTI